MCVCVYVFVWVWVKERSEGEIFALSGIYLCANGNIDLDTGEKNKTIPAYTDTHLYISGIGVIFAGREWICSRKSDL